MVVGCLMSGPILPTAGNLIAHKNLRRNTIHQAKRGLIEQTWTNHHIICVNCCRPVFSTELSEFNALQLWVSMGRTHCNFEKGRIFALPGSWKWRPRTCWTLVFWKYRAILLPMHCLHDKLTNSPTWPNRTKFEVVNFLPRVVRQSNPWFFFTTIASSFRCVVTYPVISQHDIGSFKTIWGFWGIPATRWLLSLDALEKLGSTCDMELVDICVYLFFYISIHNMSVCLSVYLPICLSVCRPIHPHLDDSSLMSNAVVQVGGSCKGGNFILLCAHCILKIQNPNPHFQWCSQNACSLPQN